MSTRWYVRFEDGSANWGGIAEANMRYIRPLTQRITFMDFGDGGYIVRHE